MRMPGAPYNGECLLCWAEGGAPHAKDCRAGELSMIADGFTRVNVESPIMVSNHGTIGNYAQPEVTVTIQPKIPMPRGAIQYVDGHPIGIVQQVNDDGTVDVLLTPKAPVTPEPFKVVDIDSLRTDDRLTGMDFNATEQRAMQHAKTCPECKGTGIYISPITNKQSPCSLGCKIQ